jgi:hypothetical protein
MDAVVGLSNLLIRIDLPSGTALKAPPVNARVTSLTAEDQGQAVEFIEFVPAVDPQLQGQGLLFLAKTNSLSLAVGTAVTGHLQLGGESLSGLVIPRPAVVRLASKSWVYVQTESTNFMRHAVALDHPLEAGWLVSKGLAPETKIVVTGAQELLSTELVSSMTGD